MYHIKDFLIIWNTKFQKKCRMHENYLYGYRTQNVAVNKYMLLLHIKATQSLLPSYILREPLYIIYCYSTPTAPLLSFSKGTAHMNLVIPGHRWPRQRVLGLRCMHQVTFNLISIPIRNICKNRFICTKYFFLIIKLCRESKVLMNKKK